MGLRIMMWPTIALGIISSGVLNHNIGKQKDHSSFGDAIVN